MRRPDFLKKAAAPGCGRRDGTGPPPPASTVLRIALARDNAASLNLAASCQPVPVTFSSRTSWCPLNVAELL